MSDYTLWRTEEWEKKSELFHRVLCSIGLTVQDLFGIYVIRDAFYPSEVTCSSAPIVADLGGG